MPGRGLLIIALAAMYVVLCAPGVFADHDPEPATEKVVVEPDVPPSRESERESGRPGGGFPGYGVLWYPFRPVSGQDTDFGLVRQQISLGVPIWKDTCDALILTGRLRNTVFFTDAILPDSGRPFPGRLWNVRLGLAYKRQLENGWSLGLSTHVGSASDLPFHSIDEMIAGGVAFVRIPVWDKRDAWLFSLMYSPTGNLNFPIPGVAYAWNPSEQWRFNLGLPFSVRWRPTQDWAFNLSYMPLVRVQANASYRVCADLKLQGGFEWLQEVYLLADRQDVNDRFLGYEKQLFMGIRWDLWRHASLDLRGGYAFDRYYGTGRNQIRNLQDQVDIESGAFLGLQVRLRF